MKLERISAAVLLMAAGGAVGCKAYPTYKNLPLNCDIEAAYDIQIVDTYEMVGMSPGWTASDGSGNAIMTGTVQAITDGARCNSTAALVITAASNNDWGSLFGFNNFGPRDESAYEGMSFWARAPGNTSKGFTLLLDDTNTNNPTGACVIGDAGAPPMPPDAGCRNYCNDGGTGTGTTDPGTGMIIPGSLTSAPEADQCGNSYSTAKTVTSDWRFYTIPFGDFQQGATPNRVPNASLAVTGPAPGTALLTEHLLNFIIRMPKAATTELWIDNLSFYRRASATGGDAGVAAP